MNIEQQNNTGQPHTSYNSIYSDHTQQHACAYNTINHTKHACAYNENIITTLQHSSPHNGDQLLHNLSGGCHAFWPTELWRWILWRLHGLWATRVTLVSWWLYRYTIMRGHLTLLASQMVNMPLDTASISQSYHISLRAYHFCNCPWQPQWSRAQVPDHYVFSNTEHPLLCVGVMSHLLHSLKVPNSAWDVWMQ